MSVLANPRHELFAQGRAEGLTADAAYEAAGYKPSRAHASRLAANGSIRARVAELQARAAAGVVVTTASLIELGLKIIDEARKAKDFGPASATLERVAKIAGLWVDQSKSDSVLEVVIRDEWAAPGSISQVGGAA